MPDSSLSQSGARVRVLVGDSVWENATLCFTENGWLYVEFDADDLDNIAIPLDTDRDLEEVAAALRGPQR